MTLMHQRRREAGAGSSTGKRRRLWLGLSVATAVAMTSARPDASRQAGFKLGERVATGRLRTFAQPGDLGLRNRAVTAVIRARDGRLVDFWRNGGAAHSTAQLATAPPMDGLWIFRSDLRVGGAMLYATHQSVELRDDAVISTTHTQHEGHTLVVTTRRSLVGDEPALRLVSQVAWSDAGPTLPVELLDRVKWGNVLAYADGIGALTRAVKADVRWVGRRGAGGDLLLEAAATGTMRLEYAAFHPGLRPEIVVAHSAGELAPGVSLHFERTLRYRPVPSATPSSDEPHEAPSAPSAAPAQLEATVVDQRGRPLPAKLTFRGLAGTPDPSFDREGDASGVDRFVWSGTGRFARSLPPGRYAILATAGIERDAARWEVRLGPGQSRKLTGRLPRVLHTPGWISADLHLHQAPSVDADVSFTSRVLSVAAEGVEMAVATDHYEVTDLGPTVRALERAGRLVGESLRTMIGSEISTTGKRFGHFNLFPMESDARVHYHESTPRRLFESMRAAAPGGLLQVNHPRWPGIGYFHHHEMDPDTGAVPPEHADEYDARFDALEVFNGVDAAQPKAVRAVLEDWLHLLGSGHRYTGTGNSDSHKLAFHDPGVPRNLVRWGSAESDAEDLKVPEASFVAAVRSGHVVVTSGPFIRATVDGAGPGDTVHATRAQVELRVVVEAAPWIDVSEVEVLQGGKGRRIARRSVAPSTERVRLDARIPVTVTGETFVVVLARGREPLPNVHDRKIRPFAFTNPIWLERRR